MKINENILDILANSKIEGNLLYLPDMQLDRKVYLEVNKCLDNLGGKWSRSKKAHLFDSDPSEGIDNILLTGESTDWKKELQFYPTPKEVAEVVCDLAEINKNSSVLEPSCGKGDLADVIYEREPLSLLGVEVNPKMATYLGDKPYEVKFDDFLAISLDKKFDRVIMNPPFSRQQDVDHVLKEFDDLASGGILVSLMSPSAFFRSNKKSVEFRDWLIANNAEVTDVESGKFKSSGTMIATKIIKVKKI